MTAAAVRLLDRGVWPAEYLIDGFPVLHAIDSKGNCLRRVRLADGVDEDAAHEWLAGLLEHYDPRPALRLVKPDRPPPGTLSAGVYLAVHVGRQARLR